jgi:CBS domain-containing protein
MQSHRVRRLVVVGDAGRLEGVVSLADIARHALRRPASDLGAHLFLATLVGSLSRPWRAPSSTPAPPAGVVGEAAPDAG